ncbi:MAG: InlB B-repeat-containing protein [Clostridia bacterium]|nr:InlB B-repeat-containing protein [Clostridia bacterium]
MRKIKKCLLTLGLMVCGSLTAISLTSCKDDTAKYVFNTNGGEEIASVEKEVGSSYTLPVPTKEGYSFEGWYTSDDFSGESVTTLTVGSSKTFYAKWEKLCVITLNLDGGALANVEDTLYLKAGANVYEFMQAYVPTKNGLTFGAWFDGENELAQNKTITDAGITLKAKYKVAYIVELWTEKISGDGYEKVLEDVQSSAYVDTTFTSEQTLTGFTENKTHADAVTQKTLSATVSDNVFKHYFNRMTYNVAFHTNFPDGSGVSSQPQAVKYGEYISVPTDYQYEGYCLIGWATSATGEVVYKTNYLENRLFNRADGQEAPVADTFTPERHTTLFAVWAKGRTDVFGGNDYIYRLDENSKDVYLSRGNIIFKGEYSVKNNEFIFLDENEDVLFSGKMIGDSTYAYYNAVRSEVASSLYKVGEGLVPTTKIYFDEYNGISYVADSVESNGTYYIDKEGYYVATFTEGELSGKTLTILTGTVTADDGSEQPAFQLRNEDEVALGSLSRFVANGAMVSLRSEYQLTLNGWGTATYVMGATKYTFSYTMDAEKQTITLSNSNGVVEAVARVVEINDKKGFTFYEEGLERTLTIEGTDAQLTLDGACQGKYVSGTKTLDGYFTYIDSIFGGWRVTFTSTTNKEYTFLVKVTTPEDEDETDDVTPDPIYTVTQKPNGYAEYYYKDANGTYYAPMLVINDVEEGYATVYGYTTEREYVEVSSGKFEYDEHSKLYVYTREELKPTAGEASTSPVDLTKVIAFKCALDTSSTSYRINYWYEVTTDKGSDEFNKEYVSSDPNSNATLTIIAGLAIYREDGAVITGEYSTSEGITAIVSRLSNNVYLEIDEENGTFITLEHAPYNAYLVDAKGVTKDKEYIVFNGKGGATYTVETEDGKEEFVGTFEQLDKTSYEKEETVYRFTATGKTFEYILIGNRFYPYNETYNGQYRSSIDGGRLNLDGYSYWASYTDTDGTVYAGSYCVSASDVIALTASGTYRYFKLTNETFVALSAEYGVYAVVDNQAEIGLYVEMDGANGKLSVFTLDGEDRTYITQDGSYEKSGDVFTLTYAKGGETVTLVGECPTLSNAPDVFGEFVISHKEVVRTFVTQLKDGWTVLTLDDVGNATKYDETGVKSVGAYTLISDTMLYYENSDGSDGCIYVYDVAAGTATPIQFSARGYYTKDLESLLFSKYGFAIFNGGERYYYNIVNNDVVIYRQDPLASDANEYGFVEDKTFGRFTDVKEYGGKEYYANNGLSISFVRDEATEEEYPILNDGYLSGTLSTLIFSPTGNGEFSVQGKVTFGAKQYNCNVAREMDEDGNVTMYVEVAGALGVYRYDITVTYNGEKTETQTLDNTYKITAMRCVRSAVSYNYLDTYYRYYYFLGSSYASTYENDIGTLSINRIYDVEGTETECYVTAEFGEGSEMFDLNGELLSFEKATYHDTDGTTYPYAEFTAKDGYTYRLYFIISYHPAFVSAQGYRVYALTRCETIEANDGYTVKVERVITSEANIASGRIFSVELLQNDETIETDNVFLKGNTVSYVTRTKDDRGDITATTYYTIVLEENDSDSIGGENGEEPVKTYKTATVTSEEVQTYYTEDGTAYVDVSETKGVLLMVIGGETIFVDSCTTGSNDTYTVVAGNDKTYTVTIADGKAAIEEVNA